MIPAFFITNVENETSYKTGKENVARANFMGDFKAEIFEGVKGKEAYDFFENENIKFLNEKYQTEIFKERNKTRHYDKLTGQAGCFASHYKLWNKCVELNKIIGIFEYDARQLKTMPDWYNFEDVIQLTAWYAITPQDNADLVMRKQNEMINGIGEFKGYNRWGFKNTFIESSAYLIKPKAAKVLIETAKNKGWFPVDRFFSTDISPIRKQTINPMVFKQIRTISLTSN